MLGHPAAGMKVPCWLASVLQGGWVWAVQCGRRLLGQTFNFRGIFINKNIRDDKIPAISGVSQLILNLPAMVATYDF